MKVKSFNDFLNEKNIKVYERNYHHVPRGTVYIFLLKECFC